MWKSYTARFPIPPCALFVHIAVYADSGVRRRGEDCTIQISVLGGECTVQPREDSVGEYTVLNLYLKPKPTFCVQFTKSCTVRTVCDAYSIKGTWAAKYKNLAGAL